MALKVKVSKEGHSATSLAVDDKDLVFGSDWLGARLVDIVTTECETTDMGGGWYDTVLDYTHNLSYVPIVWGYIQSYGTQAAFGDDETHDGCYIKFAVKSSSTKITGTITTDDSRNRNAVLLIFQNIF